MFTRRAWRWGRQLARECPIKADVVVPVPIVVTGRAWLLDGGISYEMAFVRNHIGRSFLQPTQLIRDFNVARC
jgi:amidophosphoribosyltransferase